MEQSHALAHEPCPRVDRDLRLIGTPSATCPCTSPHTTREPGRSKPSAEARLLDKNGLPEHPTHRAFSRSATSPLWAAATRASRRRRSSVGFADILPPFATCWRARVTTCRALASSSRRTFAISRYG